MNTPNPGSKEAQDKGCTCPVIDNGYGDPKYADPRGFWITKDCPLHDTDLAAIEK